VPSARHACNCDYCIWGREKKKELQFGGTDTDLDNEALVRYRKSKRRSRKVCAKSKANEPCDRLGRKVKGTVREYDYALKAWVNNKPRIIECCSRCGREHWWSW